MDTDERLTVEQLEEANAELRRENARLARKWLGKSNSAAASLLAKVEAEREELKARLGGFDPRDPETAQRQALIDRVEELHQQVLEQERQIRELTSSRAWRLASRYWAARDGFKNALRRGGASGR